MIELENKKPIYIELLELLESQGATKRVCISSFMLERYGPLETTSRKNTTLLDAKLVLDDLADRKLIEIDRGLHNFSISGSTPQKQPWFDTAEFNACITSAGLDYLNQYRIVQSNLALNEASKRNAEIQKSHSIITIIVAVLALFISLIGALNACNH